MNHDEDEKLPKKNGGIRIPFYYLLWCSSCLLDAFHPFMLMFWLSQANLFWCSLSPHVYSLCFFQALVILLTLGFCGTGIYGTYLIRQEFDPVLLLPAQSYLRQWLAVQGEHFPSAGWDANIYTGPLNDLENDLEQMDQLANELQSLVKEGRILRGT